MKEQNVIDDFLKNLEASMLIERSDESAAYENMTTIAIECFRNQQKPSFQLSDFLDKLHKIYKGKIAAIPGEFIYYCWLDEMSGEIRASIIQGANANDLPFGCNVISTDDLSDFAEKALSSKANGFINFDDVSQIGESDADDDLVWSQLVFMKRIFNPC